MNPGFSPGYRIHDRFQLIEVAGKGGMAVVWRALQHGEMGFCRTVAVKQMHDHLSGSQLYLDMFAEEARVLADLESPNIASVYDFLCDKGNYCLVMEWIDGIDLGSYIRHFHQTNVQTRWELVTAIGIGLLKALATAHERRGPDGRPAPVLHRDVSPHNILITTKGQVKLIDFGLALAKDRSKELTEPGIVKGKMSYLCPEVVQGRRPSSFSDQFAAAIVLWEALVGRKLFDGESDLEVFSQVKNAQIQPLLPNRKDIPRELAQIIHRGLAASEGQRYSSAREMGRQLSLTLRSARAPKDLHELLGRSVVEAREGMEMGMRTGEASTTTPVADFDLATLDEGKPVSKSEPVTKRTRKGRIESEPGLQRATRGILHHLPFFGKRDRE